MQMGDPQERYIGNLQGLGDDVARWILDAQLAVEQLASQTGKRQERTVSLQLDADHCLLRVHFVCEPRQFATRTLEGELADVAKQALGGR